jgi:hypothetical protein
MLALLTLERYGCYRHVHDKSHPCESAAYILGTTTANLGAGASQSVTLPKVACGTICQLHDTWRSSFVNRTWRLASGNHTWRPTTAIRQPPVASGRARQD